MRIRQKLKIALIILLGVGILIAGNVFSAEKHKCNYCHVPHGMGTEVLLKAPLSELCFECHPDRRGPNEHKVDVIPSMNVSELPLNKDGKMTCITCHDPHGKNSYSKLLRIEPSELCLKCHFNENSN